MVVKLKEVKRDLSYSVDAVTSLSDQASRALRSKMLTQKHADNLKLVDDMKSANERNTARSTVFKIKSDAMIASADSYIIAERSHNNDQDEHSDLNANIFELTSPRQEKQFKLGRSTQGSLPLISLSSPKGANLSKDQLEGRDSKAKFSWRMDNISKRLKDESAQLDLRKTAFFQNNADSLKDQLDLRVGKKHKKIKIDRQLQKPLFHYDLPTMTQEKAQAPLFPDIPPGPDPVSSTLPQAFSKKHTSTGELQWQPCSVKARISPGKYVIEWLDDKKRKVVDRLNLRYDCDMDDTLTVTMDDRVRQAIIDRYDDLYVMNLDGS